MDIEILSPANCDVYEPPQAEDIVLVDKLMMWSESVAL